MPKRTLEACEEGEHVLNTAKVQESANVYDDAKAENFQSSYGVSEMYHLIPIPLLKELFDFLDIRQAMRLCRVSHTWKAVLMKSPIRNHGIAVLHQPAVGDKALETLYDTLLNIRLRQRKVLLVEPKSIEHFIFIGQFSMMLVHFMRSYHGEEYFVSRSVKKVTWCEAEVSDCMFNDCMKSPALLKYVNFVKCTADVLCCRAILPAEDEFLAAALTCKDVILDRSLPEKRNGNYYEGHFGIVWHLKVFSPHLRCDASADARNKDHYCVRKKLDEYNLIWPYPKEQLQWLLETLKGLEGTILQSVKNTDKVWMRFRSNNEMGGPLRHRNCYRDLDVVTKASCDGRKLQTIDLAFLGRLLVCMNKAKAIPDFQPPPFEFPGDFKYGRLG